MIHKEDIDKIFEAARVEEVVADYVTLKKRGVNLIGLCPFHDEKTPSFYVSPAKGIYKCFGCGKGGHAVNFLMDKEQLSYPDALRAIAKKYNIQIKEEEQSPEQLQSQNERESLFVVSSFAQKHFSENLYNTDEGKSIGLSYFRERGFREDIIQKFQLGYSSNNRSTFTDVALTTGYKLQYLVKAGLTIDYTKEETNEKIALDGNEVTPPQQSGKAGEVLDRFRGRVMFPIHNISGRVIAFGGRTLRTDTKKIAKYINSPETDIYHKSDVLYGIYFAKKEIIKEDNCFLTEGYTDVISMHQAGIENVVASSGTSLTTGQIKLISRFTKNITILYDGDNAGIKASFRGIDLILEEGMNVKVLLFPDGEDPDSYSKRVSSEELKTFIKNNSKNFVEFKSNILISEAGNDPARRVSVINEIAETLSILSGTQSEQYIRICCQLLNIDEQRLIDLVNKKRSDKSNKKRKETPQIVEESNSILPQPTIDEIASFVNAAEHQERDIIRLLINYGNKNIMIDSEDEEKQPIQIGISAAQLLIHELQHDNIALENILYKTIFNEFVTHLEKDNIPDYNYFISHENNDICALTIDLISSPYHLSNWGKHSIYITMEEDILKQSLYSAVFALKSRKLEMMIHDIQKRLKENPAEEEIMTLMQKQQLLLQAKKDFNAQLGRIIVK